jgi:hypothetical protein
LHDAYNIPAHQRRNYTALDAAIRANDAIARKILLTRTPLTLYHQLRKQRNAIVHPVQVNGRMPAFPLNGMM